ncbi:MAG: hypothetical protein KF908_05365 [Nitrosomonas sp.]|nr:hypothetical protein [Nitrosomonas sp.]
MKTAIALLITSLYGVDAPVHVNSVEMRAHGPFETQQSCDAAIAQKPATLINDTGADLVYRTSGICVDTVPHEQATHYLSLSLQTIYSGYGVQVSDAITSIPFGSAESCDAALAQSVNIIPEWAYPYSVLSGKCAARN